MAAACFDEKALSKEDSLYKTLRSDHTDAKKTMASTGSTFSAFHDVSAPGCGPYKSFSIRRILDLPEDSDEKCVVSSSSSSSAECYPQGLPLVPRVVRPMVHNCGDNVPCTGLVNCQDYGLTPYAQHWGRGVFHSTYQGFPLGK